MKSITQCVIYDPAPGDIPAHIHQLTCACVALCWLAVSPVEQFHSAEGEEEEGRGALTLPIGATASVLAAAAQPLVQHIAEGGRGAIGGAKEARGGSRPGAEAQGGPWPEAEARGIWGGPMVAETEGGGDDEGFELNLGLDEATLGRGVAPHEATWGPILPQEATQGGLLVEATLGAQTQGQRIGDTQQPGLGGTQQQGHEGLGLGVGTQLPGQGSAPQHELIGFGSQLQVLAQAPEPPKKGWLSRYLSPTMQPPTATQQPTATQPPAVISRPLSTQVVADTQLPGAGTQQLETGTQLPAMLELDARVLAACTNVSVSFLGYGGRSRTDLDSAV